MCPECRREVAALRAAATELAFAVPALTAPTSLKARVLDAIEREPVAFARPPALPTPARRPVSGAWWLAAAATIGAIVVGGYALALRAHINFLDQALSEARAQAQAAQRQLVDAQAELARAAIQVQRVNMTTTILASADLVDVDLKGQPAAPAAAGHAFWSRSRGTLFTASGLPALPASQVYQLWMVTPSGPLSAGLLSPDQDGRTLHVADATASGQPAAFAVTIEPAGGVPAPTGERVLIGAL